MGKLVKSLLYLIGGLVLVVVAAAIIIPLAVDPNDYKSRITELVEQQTGRALTIDGQINLSVFPWVGLELAGVSLANDPLFADEPMARLETVSIKVRLLPLLSRRIEVKQVVLDGLNLNLARDRAGRGNWMSMTPGAGPESAPEGEAEPSPGQSDDNGQPALPTPSSSEPGGNEPALALAGLTINGVEITNAAIRFVDQATGDRVDVTDFRLISGALASGSPTPIEMVFSWENAQPQVSGDIAFKATLDWEADNQRIGLEGTQLTLRVGGAGLGFDQLDLALMGAINANLARNLVNVDGLDLRLALQGGDAPPEGLDLGLSANLRADLEAQTLTVAGLRLDLVDILHIQGDLKGTEILGDSALTATLAAAPFSPRALLTRLGRTAPETADPGVLNTAALRATLTAGLAGIGVNQLALQLDDTQVTGKARFNLAAAPAIAFNLAVDAIDLDRYLPPPAPDSTVARGSAARPAAGQGGADAPPSAAPTAAAPATAPLPLEPLRALSAKGEIRIGQITAHGMRMSEFALALNADGGLIRLDPITAKLYQGSLSQTAQFDARGDQLIISAQKHLQGVALGPLLHDALQTDLVSGAADIDADLTARGVDADALIRNLNGTARFEIHQGAVIGLDIERRILAAYALLKQREVPLGPDRGRTPFDQLSGSARIIDGVVHNSDLTAANGLIAVRGEGTVDLPGERIDYLAATRLLPALEEIDHTARDLRGLEIPVRIKGGFAGPEIHIALTELLQSAAATQAREKLEQRLRDGRMGERLRQAEERLGVPLGDALQNLLPF